MPRSFIITCPPLRFNENNLWRSKKTLTTTFCMCYNMEMSSIIGHSFFERSAVVVAKDLIGCVLVCKQTINGKTLTHRLRITETEAYEGPKDRASHAFRGKTARNAPMFGKAGHWYVYFVYGIHWLLNVTTGAENHPGAVLIRGLDGISGPARLTKALGIDRAHNTLPAVRKSLLWIESPKGVKLLPREKIIRTARIGVAYAGPVWSKKKYRFVTLQKSQGK